MKQRAAGAVVALVGILTLVGCGMYTPAITVTVFSPSQSPAIIATTVLSTPTPSLPTFSPDDLTLHPVSCANLERSWGNWVVTIDVLNRLIASHQTCGEEPLKSKLYAAHFNFAVVLEQSGNVQTALENYHAAFNLNPRRDEALKALARLNNLPAPTAAACATVSPNVVDPSPTEQPDLNRFVTIQNGAFIYEGQIFMVKGVNYYPRHAPWQRFLEQANIGEISDELDLIQQAGFNTIRIFLWYEPLFNCAPELAVPVEAMFAKLDSILTLAEEHHLKVIVTLNDLPDLYFRSLYTDFARYDAQTAYIVRRYRNSSVIMAWDIRNEGDLDYLRANYPGLTQDRVVNWVKHISAVVKQNDSYHPITAGWFGDPGETEPYVDFLSFHHWESAEQLTMRINDYKVESSKPLLLEEVGYHSWNSTSQSPSEESAQATNLQQAIRTADSNGIAGWLVWTAFDFDPEPGQPENIEHYFGLWRLDLTAKPSLDMLPFP
jgi:hypothetical protein